LKAKCAKMQNVVTARNQSNNPTTVKSTHNNCVTVQPPNNNQMSKNQQMSSTITTWVHTTLGFGFNGSMAQSIIQSGCLHNVMSVTEQWVTPGSATMSPMGSPTGHGSNLGQGAQLSVLLTHPTTTNKAPTIKSRVRSGKTGTQKRQHPRSPRVANTRTQSSA